MNERDMPYSLDDIDQYLRGRMVDTERDDFEAQLIDNPLLQREVQIQADLMDGMKGAAADLLAETPPGILGRIQLFIVSPAWAYAATLMLALTTGLLLVEDKPEGLVFDRVVYVEQMRSGSLPTVEIKANQKVLLTLDAVRFKGAGANLVISDEQGTVLALNNLVPDPQQLLHVALPEMPAGTYRGRLSDPQSGFDFEVVVTP